MLAANVALLDTVYSKMRLDCLILRGASFGPSAIRWVGQHLGVGPNLMFMAMPDEYFPHKFAALGGLRIITRAPSEATRRAREQHARSVLLREAAVLAAGSAE
jgi:arginase family enzyme